MLGVGKDDVVGGDLPVHVHLPKAETRVALPRGYCPPYEGGIACTTEKIKGISVYYVGQKNTTFCSIFQNGEMGFASVIRDWSLITGRGGGA